VRVSVWDEFGDWGRTDHPPLSEEVDPHWYILYMTEDLTNGMIYVGATSRRRITRDGYLGSGSGIREAVKEHGKGNFRRTTLCRLLNIHEAAELEAKVVTVGFAAREDTYNIYRGGSVHRTVEVKASDVDFWAPSRPGVPHFTHLAGAEHPNAKVIEVTDPEGNLCVLVGGLRKFCEERGLSYSSMCHKLWQTRFAPVGGVTFGWNIRFSEDVTALTSTHNLHGENYVRPVREKKVRVPKVYTDEERERVYASRIGRVQPQETRDRISAAQKGKKRPFRPLSPEHRARIREGMAERKRLRCLG